MPDKKQLSRADDIEARGGVPLMPDLGHEVYLWVHLSNAGLCMSGFNGAVPLTASELAAWQQGTKTYLSPWDFSTILALSRAYCSELVRAKNPDQLPPYGNPFNEFDRTKLAKTISNNFKAFIAASKKR